MREILLISFETVFSWCDLIVAESGKDQAFYLSVVWESMMRFLHIGLGGEDEEDFGTPKLLDIWKNPDRFGSQKFNCRIF